MAEQAKKAHEFPFYVALVGKSDEDGAMKGFEDEKSATADAADRNSRAGLLGVKATYEIRQKS